MRPGSPHLFINKYIQSYAFIFLLAFVVRLLFLLQIKDGPFFSLLLGDAESYDTWAREIAAGNYLGDTIFYQTPFYPYFLAIVYSLFGRNLILLRVIQASLGALGCYFVAKAGKNFFSFRSGYIAGILLSLYPLAIIFDLMVQKAFLGLFFQAFLLFCLSKMIPGKGLSLKWPWLTGLILGCFCLTRENAQIYIPLLFIWYGHRSLHLPNYRKLIPAFCFILGLSTVLAPVAIRNKIVGGEFVITTSQLGSNFYLGNNKKSIGLYQPLAKGRGDWKFERVDAARIAEESVGHSLSPRQVSNFWLKQTFLEIKDEPLRWIKLMATKWFLFFNSFEITDTDDPMMFLEDTLVMKILWYTFHFGVLIPLSVLGIYFTKNSWKRLWILYAMILVYAASVTLFFLFSRYRFPVVAIIVIFAGAGISYGYDYFKNQKNYPAILKGLALALLAALISNWDYLPRSYFSAFRYRVIGQALLEKGQPLLGIKYYEKSIEYEQYSVEAHLSLGYLYLMQKNVQKAKNHLLFALALNPGDWKMPLSIAKNLYFQEHCELALIFFKKALAINPNLVEAQDYIKTINRHEAPTSQ